MAYSMDFRKAAVAYKQAGHTFAQLNEVFGIPPATFYQWEGNLQSGYYEREIKRVRNRKIDKEKLEKEVAEKPDIYLRELAGQFGCTVAAVCAMLKKLKITRKKSLLLITKNQKKNVRTISSK